MTSTLPEIDFAAAIRPPLAIRTAPLIEFGRESPLMSDTLMCRRRVARERGCRPGAVTV